MKTTTIRAKTVTIEVTEYDSHVCVIVNGQIYNKDTKTDKEYIHAHYI